jgi:hypothetical protein
MHTILISDGQDKRRYEKRTVQQLFRTQLKSVTFLARSFVVFVKFVMTRLTVTVTAYRATECDGLLFRDLSFD